MGGIQSKEEEVKVEINLDGFLLGRILSIGLAMQHGKQQEVDGALAGTDKFVKQVLSSR
jgi:hypothetical protein